MKGKQRQVALFGASADIATEVDLRLADQCGAELAKLGVSLLVGGDDGVMGAAAQSAKRHGGTVVAVVSRQKELKSYHLFDAVIDTGLGWVQFSDAIIRSAIGALVISGGAGTIGELSLMYLNQLPFAIVGSNSQLAMQFGGKPLDSRGLIQVPVFEDPQEAVFDILSRSAPNLDPPALLKEAWDFHCENYPFGSSGEYLQSATRFQEVAMLGFAKERVEIAEKARAHLEDALGDHFYYHVGDHFRAASHYKHALELLAKVLDDGSEEFRRYLIAIIIESLAIGLEDPRLIDLAAQLYSRAADSYRDAVRISDETSHIYLRHSAAGLYGDAHRVTAVRRAEQGLLEDARNSIDEAERYYDEALSILPRWGESNLSDSYSHYIEKLNSIRDEISRQEESRRM